MAWEIYTELSTQLMALKFYKEATWTKPEVRVKIYKISQLTLGSIILELRKGGFTLHSCALQKSKPTNHINEVYLNPNFTC